MKLPRRVPWADISELEELCSWIYADEDDINTKVRAIDRLTAWKVNTALPHSLDSVLSLLIAILEDDEYSNSPARRSSSLGLRQSYSLALIRMVNGLVDPLQQGAYARSIAAIAGQIGLPLWLVELRHASTHEELPSLELLREGARDSLNWFLNNFFLPTLSPTSQASRTAVPLTPIDPLLAEYKHLLKSITRDVSLKSRSAAEVKRILRAFDNWISEARTTASMMAFDVESAAEEEEAKDRWAMEQFSDGLLRRGGLVPVSKRKRPSLLQGLSVPTPQYINMWSPLILHISNRNTAFPSILLHRIVAKLLPSSEINAEAIDSVSTVQETNLPDPTYDHMIASWGLWIVERWSNESHDINRKDVIKHLLLGLSRANNKA
ncbi:hypothetical protein M422DRAFT_166931 [Sphaerobolus stellatus SS14]|uniref:Las1-domain-containing protein n=1 Tax=Sphaerobolus stellatus (strain SS14) TaxID=990650 RepID=A0A0C9VRX3_SPHS4|nr:hypothetical protein M422DRAFT_166931 [Sphaerobolus stellatus SS14]